MVLNCTCKACGKDIRKAKKIYVVITVCDDITLSTWYSEAKAEKRCRTLNEEYGEDYVYVDIRHICT